MSQIGVPETSIPSATILLKYLWYMEWLLEILSAKHAFKWHWKMFQKVLYNSKSFW